MTLLLIVATSALTIATVAWLLAAWFTKHDTEARRVSELFFESPTSLDKTPAPSIFSEASKTLTIVIPAYNEQSRLPSTLDETMRYLQRRRNRQGPHFTYEVIIVDDGSRDRTVAVAQQYVRQHGLDAVRVLQLPCNHGKGYAVKAGMLVGRGELLLFMDADGATRVSDVEKLEAGLSDLAASRRDGGCASQEAGNSSPVRLVPRATEGMGIAVGSRAHLEADAVAQRAWYRNLLMHGFHLVVLLVAGGAVRDTQCGFKLFTRRAARVLYANQRLQRWCFDVELIYLAQRLRIPVVEASVNWTEIAGSKVSISSVVHMTWEMAAILIGYSWTGWWAILAPAEVQQSS